MAAKIARPAGIAREDRARRRTPPLVSKVQSRSGIAIVVARRHASGLQMLHRGATPAGTWPARAAGSGEGQIAGRGHALVPDSADGIF